MVKNCNYNIKYVRHKKQLGTVGARRTGLKIASGDFIAFLDDDDLWNNNKLSIQKKILNQYSNLDFVMCNYKVNNKINNSSYLVDLNHYVKNFKREILKKPGPFLQCCLFRAKFINKYSHLFDNRAVPSEDWDWFIEISKTNPMIYNINSVLFEWNLNEFSQSANIANEAAAIEYIIAKHKKEILKYTAKKGLSLQYRRVAGLYKQAENNTLMKKYYKNAFFYHPLSLKKIWNKLQSLI